MGRWVWQIMFMFNSRRWWRRRRRKHRKNRKNERKNFMANSKWFAAAIVFRFEWRTNNNKNWGHRKWFGCCRQSYSLLKFWGKNVGFGKMVSIRTVPILAGLAQRLSKTNFSSEFIYSIAHNSVLAVFWLLISPLRMVVMMDGMQHHHICSTHLPIDLGYNRLI